MKIFGYGITIERPCILVWRGHKVPFILHIRIHYPAGNRVWKTIWGPDFFEWVKQQQQK